MLKFVAAALAVLLVSGASVAAIAVWQLQDQLDTVAIPSDEEGPPPHIGAFEGGFNILIVGSDTREGQGGIGGSAEDVPSELNDVNILLHVSEDQTHATAISFPRDLVVTIPECERENGSTKGRSTEPINTAMGYGGLACVAMTVEELTDLPVQFAGLITFRGVIEMTNAIGGVPVCVTGPFEDLGVTLPEAGVYPLKGYEALAFLRSRKGIGDGSDLTRISSQQVYLSSLVRTLKSSDTLNDWTKVYGLAQAATQNMTLSEGLGNVDTLVSIALALKDIPLEKVTFVQYPGSTSGSGVYAGKVQPIESLANRLMEKIRADEPFRLEQAGDGRGAEVNPNAPDVATPTPTGTTPTGTSSPTGTPSNSPEPEVIENLRGQTAADYTCSITR